MERTYCKGIPPKAMIIYIIRGVENYKEDLEEMPEQAAT
jgi:hypothetical protein